MLTRSSTSIIGATESVKRASLADGRVVEQGTHDMLVAERGRYWQLLSRQQVSDELDAATVTL